MDPYNRLVSDSDGYQMLGDVVFHHRHGPEEILVPPRVRIDTVDRFFADKLKPGLKSESVDLAGDVARFYHRTESVKLFLAFLRRREKTAEELVCSINALRAIGNLGDADQQKAAAEYYAYLLKHPQFDAVTGQMIELAFHLSQVSGASIAGVLDTRVAKFAAADKGKDAVSREFVVAQTQDKAVLPATFGARDAKDKILALKDPAAQAKPAARFYIGLDSVGTANWFKWSGFQLMTIVRLAKPAPAVDALRAALAAVGQKESADFIAAANGRGLKAIEFFDGVLTPEEKDALEHASTRRYQLEG